jgi:hypothetical protein
MKHRKRKKNTVDRPLRRLDYEIDNGNMTEGLLVTVAARTITESYGHPLLEIHVAQDTYIVATEILPTLVDVSTGD